MRTKLSAPILATLALVLAPLSVAHAQESRFEQAFEFEEAFDATFGTEQRAPRDYTPQYDSSLEQRIARLADGSQGRIGVYAIDLSTGAEVNVLSDQYFPMASTSKVAIAATYLAGVDAGKWSLTSEFRLPRRNGAWLSAQEHLDLMISKSCNDCTDALLAAVGGPDAVNSWMRDAGIEEFNLTRDIRTLVREDGRIDPASSVDLNDSATPRAMGQLLAGIYQGQWLSASSRDVLMNAMANTTTGSNRMPAGLPETAGLAHKTGTLSRTASDIGIFHTPDGRAVAAAIYVTGQSPSLAVENGSRSQKLVARRNRDERIADITDALFTGYTSATEDGRVWLNGRLGG